MSGVVFLDLKKAFDTVSHDILLKKLAYYNLSATSVKFFQSYLFARNQYVYVNNSPSSNQTLSHGVPQGSILGPVLFAIFINDLPLCISSSNVQCDLLADDATVHTSKTKLTDITNDLQTSLNEITVWCYNNQMCLNPTKTKSMLIGTRQKLQNQPSLSLNLTLNSELIEQVQEHRILGVTVDSKLIWNSHIINVCKTLSRNIYLLSKLKTIVTFEAMRSFYFAHIMSHINYVSNVWDSCADDHMKKMLSLHKRSVKQLLPDQELTYEERCTSMFILTLPNQHLYNKCMLMQKIKNAEAPQYLRDLIENSNRRRNIAGPRNDIKLYSKTRLDIYKKSFAFSASKCWNEILPPCLKSLNTLCFKRKAYAFFLTYIAT
jgi:hypothetical protein